MSPHLARLASLLGALAALVACEVAQPVPQARDCGDMRCEGAGLQLDPSDCECKCGPPAHNLVCAADQVCVADGARSYGCVSVLCTDVPCERGMSCDPQSGRCTCGGGPAAPVCEGWQRCEAGRCAPETRCSGVDCGTSGTCDPVDGACRCGGGPACQDPEVCEGEAGRCVGPCEGVECPEGTFCSSTDALCHCGSADGLVCTAGETCRSGRCERDVCAGVSCRPGELCDPDPEPGRGGFCRCGGIGPDFPRCGELQICDVSGDRPRCRGDGGACFETDCPKLLPGSSCDPEDGRCKCGGIEGLECGAPGESGWACAVEDRMNVCVRTCDPLGADCAGGACAYDPSRKIAVCLSAGTTPPGGACRASQGCVPGSFCAQLQESKVCRELCDLHADPDPCPEGKLCSPLPGAPGPRLGQCLQL